MWSTSLLHPRNQHGSAPRGGWLGKSSFSGRSATPRLETLEDRTVLSTLTVLNNFDSGAGSLRDTIKRAGSGDTIVFASSLNGQTITLTSDQLEINNSLDIEGPGASLLTISGNDANRIFDINEGLTVTIDGLTITHGRSVGGRAEGGGGGGAILNEGSTLNLANDGFCSNVSLGSTDGPRGGAIANHGSGSLTVVDSTFAGNLADGRVKKGQFAEGGAIFSDRDGPNVTVVRCTFTGNEVIGGDGGELAPGAYSIGAANGGALHVEGTSTLTVIDSTFTANEAIAGSGGSALKGTNFGVYNVDTGSAGAIAGDDGATLIISGSTFDGNKAIGGSNAAGGSASFAFLGSAGGGAVYSDGTTTITNSTFSGNQALGGSNIAGGAGMILVGVGHGGGVLLETFFQPAVFTVSNCTFTNNLAIGGASDTGGILAGDGIGGGLENANPTGAPAAGTITASSFGGNQSIGGRGGAFGQGSAGLGGAVANILGSNLTLNSCTLADNQAVGGAGGAGGNGGNGFGGGLYNDGASTLTVTGGTITANSATGGAAGSGGSAGKGIGGGVHFAFGGTVCLDAATVAAVVVNFASTSDPDIFGFYTLC